MDAAFLSFREEVMPACLKKQTDIIGMKGCGGDGRMLEQRAVTAEECYAFF